MTDPLVPLGQGHTAISEEDRDGLIPTYVTTRRELFAAEEANIAAEGHERSFGRIGG